MISLRPVRPEPRPTALDCVVAQYVAGERDLAGLERGVAWLLAHGLDVSYQPIAARWPPSGLDVSRPVFVYWNATSHDCDACGRYGPISRVHLPSGRTSLCRPCIRELEAAGLRTA